MQTGAIVVVRLANGPSVRRIIDVKGARVRLALGRNREARLPVERVLLETGEFARTEDEVRAFSTECESVAAELDLEEVWDLCSGDGSALNLVDIADLLWSEDASPVQMAALLLHLEREDPYFQASPDGYAPKPQAEVEAILSHRRAQAEREASIASLATCLASGTAPSQPNQHESELLDHLRGFVVYGDNYTRAAPARELTARAAPKSRDHRREAFALLARAGLMSEDEPLEVKAADIPLEFPDDVLRLAASVDGAAALADNARVDLSEAPTFTIDNAGTADRDDAISLEPHNGHYRLGIHIADAASLVEPGGPLCVEASRRSASLYLPETVIPMLPPSLSESVGSLDPDVRRPTLSVLAEITEDGDVLDWEIVPSVISSDAALTYGEVDESTAGGPGDWHSHIEILDRIASGRALHRAHAGAVSLHRPELEVSVDETGAIDIQVLDRTSMARRLVSELMILCNCLMAEFCSTNRIPVAYRTQEVSNGSALASNQTYDPVREFEAVKRMSPAKLSPDPGPHGGLGVSEYIQATAPLRRYPDLAMQRQISHYIKCGSPLYEKNEVLAMAASADVQIRELARIERQRKRYWFLKYLRETRGGNADGTASLGIFPAVVLERREQGPSSIELLEYPFRTRIQLQDGDSPGDRITVRLHDVDLWSRSAHFIRER